MTVLPIVDRELRVAARQRATYWTRLGIASGAIFVGLVVFVLTSGLAPQQTGRHIFTWLAGSLLGYCLAYGRRATADCLSQEKRDGTLGLLFLTDLKGHDVVLGKLVATSLRGFYGLLAVFPVLAVPLLLGGTTSPFISHADRKGPETVGSILSEVVWTLDFWKLQWLPGWGCFSRLKTCALGRFLTTPLARALGRSPLWFSASQGAT